jgi:hypothetical protein
MGPQASQPGDEDETSEDIQGLLGMFRHHSMSMLDWIVTMDESAVAFHIDETAVTFHYPQKEAAEQTVAWEGHAGLFRAKVHATRIKQMILALFDNKGLIYTNYVPQGNTMNAKYIMEALGKFLEIFKQKRP